MLIDSWLPLPMTRVVCDAVYFHTQPLPNVIPGDKGVTCWLRRQGRLRGLAVADLEIWKLGGICSSCAQQPYLTTLDNLMNGRRVDWGCRAAFSPASLLNHLFFLFGLELGLSVLALFSFASPS